MINFVLSIAFLMLFILSLTDNDDDDLTPP